MSHKNVFNKKRRLSIITLASLIAVVFAASLAVGPAFAAHFPLALDVPVLWTPVSGSGYLNFVEPGPVLLPGAGAPLGPSGTEEYTGWVDSPLAAGATGARVDQLPPFPVGPVIDNGITHGDRVDFDFVVENRPIEVGAIIPPPGLGPLHPGVGGFLTWEIAPTAPSAHIDPTTGLPHPLPHGAAVALPDYGGPSFLGVDVFSIIADPVDAAGLVTDPFGLVSDADAGPRNAALDYFLDFCNITTGACSPGVPVLVFVPGWDPVAVADDFVARWVPAFPGAYTHVMIDPVGADPFHDEVIQIDAVVAFVPEPSAAVLAMLGVLGMGFRRRKRR